MAFVELESLNSHIKILYFNNPETKNSMNYEMGVEFQKTLIDLNQDQNLRVLIITGRNGVFSSGGDLNLLKSFSKKSYEENKEFMKNFYKLFLSVREVEYPVIACVNGHAIGASLALALACDLRYFVKDAKYAFNFVKIGFHPGMGSSYLVKEIVGISRAVELLFTGRVISGEEAFRLGLCHNIFSEEEILEKTIQIASEVSQNAPLAIRLLKKNIYRVNSLESAIEVESRSQSENFQTRDFLEAIASLEEKRKPLFKGN